MLSHLDSSHLKVNMKKIVCSLLCACAFGLFGCDSDSNETTWEDVCGGFYSEFDQSSLSKLSKDQQKQVKDTYVEYCAEVYGGMPKCEKEEFEYFKCVYLDNTPEYWEEQNRLEDECGEKYSTDAEVEACVDKLYQACRSLEMTADSCGSKNRDAIDTYFDTVSESPYLKVKALFDSWGLDIEDYMEEFGT